MSHLVLVPAYGRDYKTAADAVDAWIAGKDWQIAGPLEYSGRYINRADASESDTYQLRFCKLAKVTVVRKNQKPTRRGKPERRRVYVAQVKTPGDATWTGNQLAFQTKRQAESYARDLALRWTAVRQWRVVGRLMSRKACDTCGNAAPTANSRPGGFYVCDACLPPQKGRASCSQGVDDV